MKYLPALTVSLLCLVLLGTRTDDVTGGAETKVSVARRHVVTGGPSLGVPDAVERIEAAEDIVDDDPETEWDSPEASFAYVPSSVRDRFGAAESALEYASSGRRRASVLVASCPVRGPPPHG